MDGLRVLQFSDLRFGNRDYEWQWQCSREKTEIIERELREVAEQIVRLAIDRDVEAVLIPGNLFDDRTIGLDDIRFLQDAFRGLGGIPVLIAPGKEDPYGASSFYNSRFLREIGVKPWPENVHIFSEKPSSDLKLPGREDVVVTGIPNTGRRFDREELPAFCFPEREGGLNILLMHASWDGNQGWMGEAIDPSDREECRSSCFDYVAFGNVQAGEEVGDEGGKIRGAASGCPYGLRTDEIGEKTVIVGQIEPGGIPSDRFETIRVAPRTVRNVKIRCGGLKRIQSLLRRTEQTLHREKTEPTDLVLMQFEGKSDRERLGEIYEKSLQDMFFLSKVDRSEVRSSFDFRKYTRGVDTELTTEGLFVRKMKGLLEKAKDARERRSLEKALEWGLDALRKKGIEFGHENQEV
jgi:DNA repair exonuclease SbcCD nuclease subunit